MYPVPHISPSVRAEAREPGHWGTWITKTGWIYEGPLVDNHFDKDCVTGVYRLTTPGGEARRPRRMRNRSKNMNKCSERAPSVGARAKREEGGTLTIGCRSRVQSTLQPQRTKRFCLLSKGREMDKWSVSRLGSSPVLGDANSELVIPEL